MGMFKFIVFQSLIKNFDFKSFDLVLYKINEYVIIYMLNFKKIPFTKRTRRGQKVKDLYKNYINLTTLLMPP